MKRLLSLAGILSLLAACSQHGNSPSSKSDLGTGLNTIDRKYGKTASDTHDAALAAMKSLDLRVDVDGHDELGGEIVGRRADGRKVTIKVVAIDLSNSNASVRVEPGDSTLAEMIQERIADKLGIGKAKAVFSGGNSENALYQVDLEACIHAAERTVKALDWIVTGRELNDTWAQLDARAPDSNPARFRMMHVDDRARRTKVTFIAGNGNTDTSRTMIARMRDEFGRQIESHARVELSDGASSLGR